jgi:hypothetical protein
MASLRTANSSAFSGCRELVFYESRKTFVEPEYPVPIFQMCLISLPDLLCTLVSELLGARVRPKCYACVITVADACRGITTPAGLRRLKRETFMSGLVPSARMRRSNMTCESHSHQSMPNLFNLLYRARRLMPRTAAACILFPLTEASVILMNSRSTSARLIPR